MAAVKGREITVTQPETRNAITGDQQKLEGGKEGVSPQAFRGGVALLDFRPLAFGTVRETKILLFSATSFVVICDGSHRKV